MTTGGRGFKIRCFLADFERLDLLRRGVNHAGTAFAFLQFEQESVPFANLARDIFADLLVEIGKHVHRHQLGQ